MSLKVKQLTQCVSVALLLTGCVTSGEKEKAPVVQSIKLPPLSAELKDCSNRKKRVPRPKGTGDITEKQAGDTIGALRKSEDRLLSCAERLIGAYEDQKQVLDEAATPPQ